MRYCAHAATLCAKFVLSVTGADHLVDAEEVIFPRQHQSLSRIRVGCVRAERS